MPEESNIQQKSCGSKKGAMLAYGVIQLGSSIISAISLAAIALSLCSIKQESKAFTECVDEIIGSGKSSSAAVSFCNGGK